MKILIADDEPKVREAFADAFRAVGHEVAAAGNGAEAIAYAQDSLPDAVVLDMMMPFMDGFEVLQRLKGDARTAAIPVALLIAMPAEVRTYPAISGRGEIFQTDLVDLVAIKPLLRDPSELVLAVERLLDGDASR